MASFLTFRQERKCDNKTTGISQDTCLVPSKKYTKKSLKNIYLPTSQHVFYFYLRKFFYTSFTSSCVPTFTSVRVCMKACYIYSNSLPDMHTFTFSFLANRNKNRGVHFCFLFLLFHHHLFYSSVVVITIILIIVQMNV